MAITALIIIFQLSVVAHGDAYTVEQQPDAPVTGLFTISPTSIEIEVEPGQTIFQDITLANRTGNTLDVAFSAEDFTGSDDPAVSTILLGTEQSPQGARNWLDPEIDSLVMNHGDTVTMRVGISVPADAEPGGHYTTFLASFSSIIDTPEGGVNVVSRVGCFFLLTIDGPVTEAGTLESPEVPGVYTGRGPVPLGLVFNNEGNIHLRPSGTVLIRNFLGMTVAELPVSEFVVMPNSSRRAELDWDSRFLFGPYTVEADIQYGRDAQEVIASSRLWAFSWLLLLGLILLLALLTAGFVWLRRRRSYYDTDEYDEYEEYEEYEDNEEAAGPAEPAFIAASAAEPVSPRPEMVPLNELFPSMEDTRTIDIRDDETHHLVSLLIEDEIEMARTLLQGGQKEEARSKLLELRAASQRMGLLGHLVSIDDLLFSD